MRQITLSSEDLSSLIQLAISKYEREKQSALGKLEYVSKNMAEKMFGFSNVKRWIKAEYIKPERIGKKSNSLLSIKIKDLYKAQERDALSLLKIKEEIV